MNLLEIFFIVSGVIIFFMALDIGSKKRFNALHFIVFLMMGGGLLLFTLFPSKLDSFGAVFGIQRGADLLVYISIIFLVYFALLLLRRTDANSDELTQLIREISISNSDKNVIDGKEVFIIPSYNEGPILIQTIKNILQKGYKNILVINDGSSDNTKNVLEESFGENKNITCIHHLKNRGQGAALETGFEYVRRFGNIEYVITFDADGQHDINDVKEFEKYLKKHKDVEVLLGSRFLSKRRIGLPLHRKIILKLGIIFTFFLSQIQLSDTHNGFRVIRTPTLEKIKISIDGMGHASEIIDIISDEKIRYKEVPVHIIYTDYSLKKGQSSGNAIKIGMTMIWNKFFK